MESKGINSRKSYEAWAATLSTQENSLLAKVEKTIAIQLGMSAPKGLREWREFVTAVVDLYMVRKAEADAAPRKKGAHRRHDEYLASIVITSNCGICGPRDKATCGVCYPADSNGYALVGSGKTRDESAAEMLSEPVSEDVFTRTERVRREYAASQQSADAMGIVLATVTADSGHIHGGVTSGEIVAAGANRGALTRAVKAGWVTMLAVNAGQAESDRAPRYYLSEAGRVERDRRSGAVSPVEVESAYEGRDWAEGAQDAADAAVRCVEGQSADVIAKSLSGPQAFALAWAAGIVLDSGLPLRPVMDQLRAMGLTSESEPVTAAGWAVLAALDVVEGQSGRPTGVTRMNVRTVIEMRHPRVKGFNRRKPSLARRGWK